MRKFVALTFACSLAACGGGAGTGVSVLTPNAPVAIATPTPTPTPAPQQNAPSWTITFPSSSTKHAKTGAKPSWVSPSSQSIVINRSAPSVSNGAPKSISAASCPCTVYGPAWVVGQSNTYTLTTYDTASGTGNALSTATVTFTPTAGQATQAVTLAGIPATIAIAGVPASLAAGTQNQSAALTVTVQDADGNTISGAYSSTVRITDPDGSSYGTSLTGTNAGSGCTATCVDLNSQGDTITLNYGGGAENAVTLKSSASGVSSANAGTATFTPVLNPIAADTGNPTSSYTPCSFSPCYGVDLFTTNSSASTGYRGTLKFKELGFTDSPYNKVLQADMSNCSSFAGMGTPSDSGNETVYNIVATAANAGYCVVTVTDGLSDQTNTLPTFMVTYTTASFSGSARPRVKATP